MSFLLMELYVLYPFKHRNIIDAEHRKMVTTILIRNVCYIEQCELETLPDKLINLYLLTNDNIKIASVINLKHVFLKKKSK
jgi:hypothetical protein